MTRKQLKLLISAGVFSVALLNGAAYAADDSVAAAGSTSAPPVFQGDAPPPPPELDSKDAAPEPSANQPDVKHSTKTDKEAAPHGCGGAGGCGGH